MKGRQPLGIEPRVSRLYSKYSIPELQPPMGDNHPSKQGVLNASVAHLHVYIGSHSACVTQVRYSGFDSWWVPVF